MSDTYVDDDLEDDDLLNETDQDTDLVRRLRRQLKTASKKAKTADDLEAENRTLKGERLIAQAGLDNLTERQRQALLREVGDEIDADKLRAAAVDLGWAEDQPDPAEQDVDEHTAISDAGRGAQGKGVTEITPAVVASWDMTRKRAFMKSHPDAWEALKRGETVRGISF